MGFFDVGSMRSKKSNAELTQEARMQRRKNDEILAANLGLDYSHGGSSNRSNGKSSRDRLHDDFATGHGAAASTAARDATRRSKLERMMGADVPLPDSLSAPNADHRRGQHQADAASQIYGSNGGSALHLPMSKGSFDAMSQHSSHSSGRERQSSGRSFDPLPGASTTFTEMAEVDCPVCLEPLSYRLAGEKPHVVPNCGHALHNACFTAVYGPPEAIIAQQNAALGAGNGRTKGAGLVQRTPAANPPGMCGVCRRAIVLGGDEATAKSQKLAGLGPHGSQADRMTLSSDSASVRALSEAHEDDPLESQAKGRSANISGPITTPTIRARPEYSTIYKKADRKDNSKVNVVCVLSVEVPSRRPSSDDAVESGLDTIEDRGYAEEEFDEEDERDYEGEDSYSDDLKRSGSEYVPNDRRSSGQRSPLPTSYANGADGKQAASPERCISPESQAGFSYSATPAAQQRLNDPNLAVVEDLRSRVADWKGHSLEHFGELVLHDLLNVRQDSVVREFHVYLFEGALLCVTEEKRKGLSRFIPAAPPAAPGATPDVPAMPKPALKLKGRIYLKHIRRVIDSSVAGELSISITMDESLDQFVLCFRDRETLSVWKERLSQKVAAQSKSAAAATTAKEAAKPEEPASAFDAASAAHSAASHGMHPLDDHQRLRGLPAAPSHGVSISRANSGAASIISGKTGSHQGALSPADYRNMRRLSNVSSVQSHGSHRSRTSTASDTVPRHQQWSASGGLDPRIPPPPMLPHTPLDLVLMFAVPPVLPNNAQGSINSSAALKLRLVRSTLDFVVSHMGPKDRVSLVAYSVGYEGEVKRTALLNPRRSSSRQMLGEFIQCIGRPWDGHAEDPFRVDLDRLGGTSERTDSVTAVNVGLDIVLQRKQKNPITGMILVNDTADGPKRHQMDLVMARAEAANVPIHCFGYGKTHDPSSLWLISNHTKGSYTFVREWYQLRECLAGCIGSMMSIALTDVKLHVSVPHDNQFRVRKIAGMPGAIISSSGKDVDIDMGDIRFGDARELLVELELDLESLLPRLNASSSSSRKLSAPPIEQGSATDDFMQRLGIQGLSLADSDGAEGSFEHLIDEVPVFEADAGFRDPTNGTSTSRLANPTILTLEIDCQSPDPVSSGPPGLAAAMADPTVTRRRLEVLVSEMITRSLLLISRSNYAQAQKVFNETRRIIETVVRAIPLPAGGSGSGSRRRAPMGNSRSAAKRQRDALNRKTIDSLMAMMNDLDTLLEGLEAQNRTTFERDGRNFGAQQAMILRDQKAWTTRTDTEYQNFRDDNAAAFAAYGASYASSR
ncbi:uncharacterized protein PFL1_04627 [Pseudozyma flocculosa PF-1]|uniref:Related to CDC24 - Guanine nucleotide exchange factor (GEF or GDP-release factor) n=2 Tax=Pseudozyma flocculosa TaxID=84751 RepID=A0A5C3FB28_9BASI|nr:uncharacterized protein PFL1_04627 [Pseudozyma flocculosa PF-1]EPQ27883.1 hypothetical protein PFL1_04627 [Pseudozyma flocculosa PF-1]SPO41664.1 related to CDC24 - Guanine nucleotide exchange factor (GEF or GDP-release factor) [Pseudozyma flocculosa]